MLLLGAAVFGAVLPGCLRFRVDEERHRARTDAQLESRIAGGFVCARDLSCEAPPGLELLVVQSGEVMQYALEIYRDGTVRYLGGPAMRCSGAYVGRVQPEAVGSLVERAATGFEPFLGETYDGVHDATIVRVRLRRQGSWIFVENIPSSGNEQRFAKVLAEIHRVAGTEKMAAEGEHRRMAGCSWFVRM